MVAKCVSSESASGQGAIGVLLPSEFHHLPVQHIAVRSWLLQSRAASGSKFDYDDPCLSAGLMRAAASASEPRARRDTSAPTRMKGRPAGQVTAGRVLVEGVDASGFTCRFGCSEGMHDGGTDPGCSCCTVRLMVSPAGPGNRGSGSSARFSRGASAAWTGSADAAIADVGGQR